MHVSVLVLGGVLGFVGGLFAYVGLGLGLVLSIGIWAASGPVTLLGLVALYLLRADQMPGTDRSHPEIA